MYEQQKEQISVQKAPVWSVSQITQLIKKRLESFFYNISIQGEISNFTRQSSGHLYFSLKDSNAQISAAMFKGDTQTLVQLPKDGDQVIVKGAINVYPPRGNYQIIVRELQFAGTGALLIKFEQLKAKLNSIGWFDKKHKKTMPKMPKKIGIVTSPTGAAIQDIINVITRRFSGIHIILNPVKVQGEGAPEEIARAIQQFNEHNLVDVMIVGRGGGSIEDLWAFNSELVAKAIFESKIPIISAVGHETDFTIADFVADLRAPTPSAAAELVTAEKTKELQTLKQIKSSIKQALNNLIRQNHYRLQTFSKHPLLISPYNILAKYMQQLDDNKYKIEQLTTNKLDSSKKDLTSLQKQLALFPPTRQIQHLKEKLNNIKKHLTAIHPKHLLSKGFAITYSDDGSIIKSTSQTSTGQNISLQLSDGTISSKITKIKPLT